MVRINYAGNVRLAQSSLKPTVCTYLPKVAQLGPRNVQKENEHFS